MPALDVVAVIWMGAPRFLNRIFSVLPHSTCVFSRGRSIVLIPDRLRWISVVTVSAAGVSEIARIPTGKRRGIVLPVIVWPGEGGWGSPRCWDSPPRRLHSAGYPQGSPLRPLYRHGARDLLCRPGSRECP